MADFKRKRAPHKKQVTKIQKQIDSLLLVEPKLREPRHLDHLVEQLERSTESYLLSYQQFLDDADEMDPKKQEEEEANHEDFMRLIESAQITLCCQSCDSTTKTSGGGSLSCGCCPLKNLSLWTSLPTRKETQIITVQREDSISFLCLPTTEIS